MDKRAELVLPDANIWASATLHSWFGLIAAEPFTPWSFYWTEDILAEAVHARRRRFPFASSNQIEQLRERLLVVIGDNQIRDFAHDTSVQLHDPLDAHVHSAATYGSIDVLVTQNVRDFQPTSGQRLPYKVNTPDQWLAQASETAPTAIDAVISRQLDFRKRTNRPLEIAEPLARAGCPNFADYVRERQSDLS